MKRIDTYNDGVLFTGFNKEIYSQLDNSLSKKFIIKNRFEFSYAKIREEDRYTSTGEIRTTLKVKVPFNNLISSSDLVIVNNKLFYIDSLDKSNKTLFLYLNDFADTFDKVIELYRKEGTSSLQDDELIFYKKVFSNIKSISNAEVKESNSSKQLKKLTFKINYDEKLILENPVLNYKIKFENKLYDIKSAVDINENHKIIVIEGVSYGN